MTAPVQQQTNEKAAAVTFGVVLALMLGGVGVVIAALAVGAEKAWNGGRAEGHRAAQRRRSWLDQQRAWIDADTQARAARTKARTEWLRSGSDPAAEPARLSLWQRSRDWFRRGVANTAVGATDFREGFADGWRSANETRRAGGGFRDVATARPSAPEREAANPKQDEAPATSRDSAPSPEDRADSASTEPPTNQLPTTPLPRELRDRLAPHNGKDHTMTQTTSPQQQAESNATVLRGLLGGIQSTLGQVSDNTDALAALRNKLQHQVDRAEEHATSSGQSSQARQSLDEARQVVTLLGQHLGAFSEGTVSAEDQVGQASAGLRSAEEAEDSLRAGGADGRAVAPATNA